MSCSTLSLKGLANDCEASMGGVREIYIANWANDLFTVSGDTVTAVADSADFYKYYIRKNTSSFTSTATIDDANGVSYVSTELALVFTKMDTAKRVEISALMLNDVAVLVKDANGKVWVLGQNNPVRMTAGTGETGTAVGDGNKYSITLTDESVTFPFEYTGDMPSPKNA